MAAGPRDGAPAEPAQRLVARIIDTLLVALPVVLVTRATLPRVTAEIVASVGLAFLLVVYDSVQHARWGQTVGKRLTGIRVVSVPAEGTGGAPGRPRPAQALLRAAVYAVPIAARSVPVLGAIAGIFWVTNAGLLLERPRRQALHDRIAGTAVVSIRN
ncbi:RDD family protein [Actinomadura scrupuli]|uniref:RDD family protein n=1 Tax=Actinomadura scrupuli TaxID=559629 RepID=UPI003D9910E5